ncbi:MAG: hypothetical protein GF329_03270 [Candidatus Lokiarchaeota archaeon]|nr:hypothetical protein [Candidatus Lokiarchaeota archaeon]
MNKKKNKLDFLDKEINSKTQEGIANRIAKIITLLTISPFQIVAYLVLGGIAAPIWLFPVENIIINIISGIFFLLIPSIPLVVLNKRKRLEGGQLSREDRYLLFITIIPGYLSLIFIQNAIGLYFGIYIQPLIHFIISYIFVLIIEFIITCGIRFKTSMHISGAVCSITAMSFSIGYGALLLFLFVIGIAWARWQVKGHTIAQLISGWTIGIFTTLIIQVILLMI